MHSKGTVHRDLSAANIMIGDFGKVLLMGWSEAVLLQESLAVPPGGRIPEPYKGRGKGA